MRDLMKQREGEKGRESGNNLKTKKFLKLIKVLQCSHSRDLLFMFLFFFSFSLGIYST